MALHQHDSAVAQRRLELLSISVVMSALGSLAVLARVISRYSIVQNIGIDDWVMVVAWMFSLGLLAETIAFWKFGLGFMSASLDPSDMVAILKATVAFEATYYTTSFVIKVSILLLYLRFGTQKGFRLACKITIAVLSVFTLVCLIVIFAQCRPLGKVWDITGTVTGKCINTTVFFYITAAFNILSDIWVTIMPIRTLISIQRPKREKAGLVLIFGMGAFSCIAAMIRLQSIGTFTNSKDPFFDAVPGDIWSVVEINVAIICASMPSLKPLLCYCSRSERTRRSGQSSNSRGYIRSGESSNGNNRRHSGQDPATIPEAFAMTSGVKGSSKADIRKETAMDASSDTASTEHIFALPNAKTYSEPRVDYVQETRIEYTRNMV